MLVLAEKREQLWRSVQQLPLHYRIALIMHYYGDFSYREIAKLMDKREGTIRVIIHRALQQLRTLTDELEARQRSSFQRKPVHRTN
jgi:RNA polymerase sigma-70 factor, ECF subfamily